jgi:hypothetical protein
MHRWTCTETSQSRLQVDEIATLFDPLPHRLDYDVAFIYYYYYYLIINTQRKNKQRDNILDIVK